MRSLSTASKSLLGSSTSSRSQGRQRSTPVVLNDEGSVRDECVPSGSPSLKSRRTMTSSVTSHLRKQSLTDSRRQTDSRGSPRHLRGGDYKRVTKSFRGGIIPEYQGSLPCVGHTAIMYGKDLYVFGGIDASGRYSAHIRYHEKRSLQWLELRGVGVLPTGRANHSAIMYNNSMIIFGGNREHDVFCDIFSFDMKSQRWDKFGYDKLHGPGPVFLHAAVYVPPIQSMLIIGGFHQREHNTHLGHFFDIRNRVWTGLAGPRSINPQHLQLVDATYHTPSTSVIVIGLQEANMMERSQMPTPSIYFLHVHSLVWTQVKTTSSPESPIPFSIEAVWPVFLLDMMAMGSYHDDVYHEWHFPLLLDSVRHALIQRPMSGSSSGGRSDVNRKRTQRYGFLKLHLVDLSWSIVPANFPQRLLRVVTPIDDRRGVSRPPRAVRGSQRSSSAAVVQHKDSLVEKLAPRTSRVASSRSDSRDGLLQSAELDLVEESSLTAMRSYNDLLRDRLGQPFRHNEVHERMLFSLKNAPPFQRKYAIAAYREPGNGKGRRRPVKYLIMHGGHSPGVDYAMLMFSLKTIRVDGFAATRGGDFDSQEQSPVSSASSDTGTVVSLTCGSLWDDDGTDSTSNIMDDRVRLDGIQLASCGPFSPTHHLAEQGVKLSQDERAPQLLPTLPPYRTDDNRHRFAILYHPNNAISDKRLLPCPATPVAVLNDETDVQEWASQYYKDTRKWLSQKLKHAVKEDRQLRRQLRKTAGPQGSMKPPPRASFSSSVSSDTSESVGGPNDGRRRLSDDKKSRLKRAHLTVAASVDRPLSTKAAPLQKDFFASKNLDLFPYHEFQPYLTSWDERPAQDVTAGEDYPRRILELMPGMSRLRVNVTRRREIPQLPSFVFQNGTMGTDQAADLGTMVAAVLLRNALASIGPANHSPEAKLRRALARWRFLRAMVCTGEGAFILYRVSQHEMRMKGIPVTSVTGLVLAPDLHLIGAKRPVKVSSRPIPYTLPALPVHNNPYAELTDSGMAVYYHLKRQK